MPSNRGVIEILGEASLPELDWYPANPTSLPYSASSSQRGVLWCLDTLREKAELRNKDYLIPVSLGRQGAFESVPETVGWDLGQD